MERNGIKLRYEGQSHQIDANTLVNTLIHYSALVESINRLHGGSRNIKLQVKALEKGSFVIDVALVENILATIFTSSAYTYISELIDIIGNVLTLYHEFKGKPVTEREVKNSGIHINATDGTNVNITNIINIYNDKGVREPISKSFETANEDSGIEGLDVDLGKMDVSFKKEEFPSLIYNDFDNEVEAPEEVVEDVDATMTIKSLSFDSGAQWKFIYMGFTIPITVKDSSLMRAIDNGARFGKGDSIRVKLRIVKKFNREYNVYENKSYKILEFYEHIINNRQAENLVEDKN